MTIAIGSDHAAFHLKEVIKTYAEKLGHTVTDCGTHSADSVDYPDFGIAVGKAVASGKADRGIVLCGSGIGISIACNKVKGIRCALCSEPLSASLSRQHNDANVLALGARIIGESMAKKIVEIWLSTDFEGGHHQRRIDKIAAFESSDKQ